MTSLDRIVVDPEICLGQPSIKGTRITVSVVLKMLGAAQTTDDILAAYPEVTREDVQQALLYAARIIS